MGAMVGAVPASFTTPWMVPPLETAMTVYGSATASPVSSKVPPTIAAPRGQRRGFGEVSSRYCPAANSFTIPPYAISIDLDVIIFWVNQSRAVTYCIAFESCSNGYIYPRFRRNDQIPGRGENPSPAQ